MVQKLYADLDTNLRHLDSMFGNSGDFYAKKLRIQGIECAVCLFDGLASTEKLWVLLLEGANRHPRTFVNGPQLQRYLLQETDFPVETPPVADWAELVRRLTSGMAVLLTQGCATGIAVSTQGLQHRGVGSPTGEGNVRGSQEGFADLLRVNISLVRRLIRTETLAIEIGQWGSATGTEIALCYDKTKAPQALVRNLRTRLERLQFPFLLDSSWLEPFLSPARFHLFPQAAYTERPAVACARICEGKVVLLVNGSPFAMVLPAFFAEHFETLDDYAGNALFASVLRCLKYMAFLLTTLLPGLYVLAVRWMPQWLPGGLLETLRNAEADTPLPVGAEMLLVLVLLEIIREAGLRMPQQLGHSVSLVAALIIGDTAVEAGLMSVPIIAVAAVASIAAYVVPSLYQQAVLLRFAVLLLCAWLGLAGLACGIFLPVVLLAAGNGQYAYLYPLENKPAAWRDGFWRATWKKLVTRPYTVEKGEASKHAEKE